MKSEAAASRKMRAVHGGMGIWFDCLLLKGGLDVRPQGRCSFLFGAF